MHLIPRNDADGARGRLPSIILGASASSMVIEVVVAAAAATVVSNLESAVSLRLPPVRTPRVPRIKTPPWRNRRSRARGKRRGTRSVRKSEACERNATAPPVCGLLFRGRFMNAGVAVPRYPKSNKNPADFGGARSKQHVSILSMFLINIKVF